MNGDPLGVMYSSSSIDPTNYNRSHSTNAYLPLAGSKLTIMTETMVAKVNLKNSYGYCATGVTLTNGTVINANQEVVISAGSFLSPRLLEMCGVGNKTILAGAGIKQLIDLPGVGENFQDHIHIQKSYQVKENYTSFDILRFNATYASEQLQLWLDGK